MTLSNSSISSPINFFAFFKAHIGISPFLHDTKIKLLFLLIEIDLILSFSSLCNSSKNFPVATSNILIFFPSSDAVARNRPL